MRLGPWSLACYELPCLHIQKPTSFCGLSICVLTCSHDVSKIAQLAVHAGAKGKVDPVSGREYGPQDFFGVIDEMRIWKTVRTPQQIEQVCSMLPLGPDDWSANTGTIFSLQSPWM